MSESLLVGETIIFSSNNVTKEKGVVMGVECVKFKPTDIYPTTAYCVLVNEKGDLRHIPYWQVIGIAEPDPAFVELLDKKDNGVLLYAYYPKFEKKSNSKNWDVDHESNDDMPM